MAELGSALLAVRPFRQLYTKKCSAGQHAPAWTRERSHLFLPL